MNPYNGFIDMKIKRPLVVAYNVQTFYAYCRQYGLSPSELVYLSEESQIYGHYDAVLYLFNGYQNSSIYQDHASWYYLLGSCEKIYSFGTLVPKEEWGTL